MTNEEKKLLIQDLCARLPYGIMADRLGKPHKVLSIKPSQPYCIEIDRGEFMPVSYTIDDVKPYLRPMSSMTEEETEEYRSLSDEVIGTYGPYDRECKFHCVRLGIKPDNPHECIDDYLNMEAIDWLNAHHFDYRGLIPMGLALMAPKDMYNTKIK